MALDKQFSMERPCIEAFWQSLREGQHEGDQQQRDAEDFFGSSSSGGHWHSRQQSQRALHRNVWSSSVEEEDRWIKCLLSANSQRNNNSFVNNPSNGSIPKIIHFIWLGEKSMPMFSFLIGYNDDEHLSVDEQFEQSVQRTIKYSSNECVESWRHHHPPSNGWEIVVWTEKDIIDDNIISKETESNKKYVLKQSQMRNRDSYRQALQMKNYGAASDILRLEILSKFGGIYADIDYFCVGSLDDIISSGNFFCGASNTGCVELNNGLMGCQTGGHRVLNQMIDSIHDYFEEKSLKEATKQEAAAVSSSMLSSFLDETTRDALKKSQTNDSSGIFLTPMAVIEHTGPGLLTRLVCRWLVANNSDVEDNASQDIIVFPFEKFNCFPNHFRKELSHNDRVTAKQLLTSFLMSKDAKAVHLWGCSWQKDQ
jgi:mannosyltransferase OCH1-like enzyme